VGAAGEQDVVALKTESRVLYRWKTSEKGGHRRGLHVPIWFVEHCVQFV